MAHRYVEIQNDSRKLSVTTTGIKQSIELDIFLDEEETDTQELPFVDEDPDYTFLDASDDVYAAKYVYSILPEFRYCPSYSLIKRVLVLDNIEMDQLGNKHWRVKANYGFNINRGSGGDRPEEGKNTLPYYKLQFNIGGGTKTIYKSDFVDQVALAPDAPAGSLSIAEEALRGAIGITADSLTGVEVPDSSLRIQITVYYLPEFVTIEFMKTIRDLIAGSTNKGSYNDDEFLGCPEGEVQLRAASGGGQVVDIIPITFDFALAKNVEDEEDEGFPNLTMKGHEVLDYIFLPEFDEGVKRILMKPAIRAIHQVAQPANYNDLEVPEEEEEGA